ncbi:MAG: hypothetical protein HQM08_27330 [Candidatus Riflebacteria bacterium]|nr:hypothetical protein [Candidatus Riflebacteria bacterium]
MTQNLINSLPVCIKSVNQWVIWAAVPRENGKIGKPPIGLDGKLLSGWQQPENQFTFDKALQYLNDKKPANVAGIGVAFNGTEPFTALDLDDCLENGNLATWARKIVQMCGSYTEISPSGKGLRVFVLGKIPGAKPHAKKGALEIFSASGYVTTTGNVFEDRREIRENVSAMTAVYKEYFEEDKQDQFTQKGGSPKSTASSVFVGLTPDEIIKIIEHSKQADKFQCLLNGDTSDYLGDSEADLGLCGIVAFYSKNPATIEAVFNQSALAQREKWQKRPDYRKRTIEKAIADCRGQYERKPEPEKQKAEKTDSKNLGFAEIIAQGRAAQKTLDEILIPARDTDKGNAERFQAVFEGKAMHTPEMGWLIWDKNHWKADERGVRDMFKFAVSEEIHKEIDKLNKKRDKESIDLIGKLSKWLKQSQGAKITTSGLQWAYSDACFRGYIDDFDKDLYVFNVQNGTINLRTGEIKPHDPKDKITKISNIVYDKNATCPTWNKFLDRIFEGKKDLIRFIQKAIGYTLTGDIKEQVWFFLHGMGQNGKSKFIDAISRLLGDYCQKADMKTFSESQIDNSTSTPELAEFPGKRFVYATETKQGKAFDCGRIKDWTGGEQIPARQIYKVPFNFFPHFKLWLAGNHKPIIKDSTFSTWRRIRYIPFLVTIPDEEKDENLHLKFYAELSGILNWAVEGCLMWQSEGLKPCKEVVDATAEYQESQDRLSPFIKEACLTGKRYYMPFKTLHETYIAWCNANNENQMSKSAFREAIQERGFRIKHGTGNAIIVDGIMLSPYFNASNTSINEENNQSRVNAVNAVNDFTGNGLNDKAKDTFRKIVNCVNSINSDRNEKLSNSEKEPVFSDENEEETTDV